MEFPSDTEDKRDSGKEIAHAGGRRWWVLLFAALLAGPLAYTGSIFSGKHAAGQGPPTLRSVPVVAAAAEKGDVHVYITGLGTVTALYTATIHTRVDGQVMKVPFKEGDIVKKDALLVEVDPRPFAAAVLQAEGQLERDKALLEEAKRDLKRYDVLAKQDSIAQQIRDDQVYLVHQDEGTVKLDQGNLDAAKVNLIYTRITAPFTGRIGLRLVDPGNIVQTTDATGVAVVTLEQPITVIFPIPEEDLPSVLKKVYAGETLQVEAYDRAQTRKIATGHLLASDNQIDTATGTNRLKAVFENKDNALFPNQFVNASLLMETLRGVTVVPTAALQRSPKGTYVYLVKEDQTVTVRWVKLGPSEGDRVSIEEGITPGDLVVVEGAERLKEGSSVEVQKQGSDSSTKGNG
ncbi:MAG: efflux RND transporter periplasmic adaptor subunit [Syntrophobacteraceae bacterium]